jgi:hypothetical protein
MGVATVLVAAGGAALAEVVSPNPATSPSFNGPIYAVAYRGGTVYVGGSFTSANTGGKNVVRSRLAAFDARTGALLPWAPNADANVRALAVDGGTVYAAGDFHTINGYTRDALAGVDATSGQVTPMRHTVLGQPDALVAGAGRLYLAGRFLAVDGVPRANLAAFSLATGGIDWGWTPTADDRVNALAFTNDRVYLGGSFHQTDGVRSTLRLSAVDPVHGDLDEGFLPKPVSQVFALAADDSGVYAALGGQGGRAIAYTRSGAIRWTRVFDGDAQAIAELGGITYVGGHFDKACTTSNNGVKGACTDGAVPRGKLAAVDSQGNLLDWSPKANGVAGTRQLTTSPALGAVSAVGDFTEVGGLIRKRYAQFDRAATLPEKDTIAGGYVASYNFDTTIADGTFDDGSGHGHLLRAVLRNGGKITLTPHATGQALTFPPKCTGAGCPRLVLQAANTPDLNPATRPLQYGAKVLLSAAETASGENVLQKGYSTGGGQYKLQVDGVSGKPSCGMSGANEKGLHLARSRQSIADGSWHSVECRRTGPTLSILVDGQMQASAAVPVDLSISSSQPFSVGGKGAGADNDQFHGSLDDIWIHIG